MSDLMKMILNIQWHRRTLMSLNEDSLHLFKHKSKANPGIMDN